MNQSKDESERDELRQAGLKITYPRLKILDLFQSHGQKHLSADDVYRWLLAENVDIGLATVYRVLGQLESVGLLRKSNIQHDKAVYELESGQHHDHLICIDCGRVVEFHDALLEKRQAALSNAMGFELEKHSMALFCNCIKEHCSFCVNDKHSSDEYL